MTDRPLYSIIIPASNGAGLEPFALHSAMPQTCHEISLSGHDSSDTTLPLFREWDSAGPRSSDAYLPFHERMRARVSALRARCDFHGF